MTATLETPKPMPDANDYAPVPRGGLAGGYVDVDLNQLAPRVSYEDFIGRLFHWKQGEHTAFIGPTESGKTTLALSLLQKQKYVTILATKPKDPTLDKFAAKHNYKILKRWPHFGVDSDPVKTPRRIVWPKPLTLARSETDKQAAVIHEAMNSAYGEGGWCLYVDELWYLINMLGLDFDAKVMLLQARSLSISFTVATQRPAMVPLEVYDQSAHLFFWRDNDERNLTRLSGIAWRSAQQVRMLIANLEMHEFLYVHRSGAMIRSRYEPITEKG